MKLGYIGMPTWHRKTQVYDRILIILSGGYEYSGEWGYNDPKKLLSLAGEPSYRVA